MFSVMSNIKAIKLRQNGDDKTTVGKRRDMGRYNETKVMTMQIKQGTKL